MSPRAQLAVVTAYVVVAVSDVLDAHFVVVGDGARGKLS